MPPTFWTIPTVCFWLAVEVVALMATAVAARYSDLRVVFRTRKFWFALALAIVVGAGCGAVVWLLTPVP